MSERRPGQKTMRFLDERMRFAAEGGVLATGPRWWQFKSGGWVLNLRNDSNGALPPYRHCELLFHGRRVRAATAPTFEAAIAQCEGQTLTLFKQLGDLCGYEVDE